MPYFKHNETDVYFDLYGSGPDLLFMHGLAADRRQGQQALDGLTGYRLIVVDMPGHGDSKLSPAHSLNDQVSFKAYVTVVDALTTHLGIESVIAGGISMGAGIALGLALARPDLVRALLLVRPAWLDRPARPHLGVIEDIGNWIAEAGTEAAAERLLEHPVYAAAVAENPTCAASIMGAIDRPQAVESAAVLSAMVADQPFSRMGVLRKCAIPALVVGNNADPLHPAMIAREISGALADASYFHAPPKYLEPLEHQVAVVKTIGQFLAQRLVATRALPTD